MRIIIFTGFLGSGKTTLLLALARHWAQAGRRVAIVENEVGRVGVDGRRLAAEGLRVREISAGCICCTLTGDLVAAVEELRQAAAPDLLLIEPSGVAAPGQVAEALAGTDDRRQLVAVLDGGRWRLLKQKAATFIQGSLMVADAAILTKSDLISPAERQTVQDEIAAWRPGLPLFACSGLADAAGANLAARLDLLAAGGGAGATGLQAAAAPAPQIRFGQAEKLRFHGGVHARQLEVLFPRPLPAEEITARLQDWLEHLRQAIRQLAGTEVLGHLKICAETAGGQLFGSIDRFDFPPRLMGELSGVANKLHLTLNAIIQGVDPAELSQRLEETLQKVTPNTTG